MLQFQTYNGLKTTINTTATMFSVVSGSVQGQLFYVM